MTYIAAHEGDLIGSIARMEGCLHTGFSSFNPAVFASGHSWQDIAFHPETGFLKFNAADTEHGPLYNYNGSVAVPELRAAVDNTILPLVGKFLVLRITDMNGRVYILGAPNQPVTFTVGGQTGTEYKSDNGYTISFNIDQTWPALAE